MTAFAQSDLPAPHGGCLINRIIPEADANTRLSEIEDFPKINISRELAIEVENIAKGVYSPLEGFLIWEDYFNIIRRGRLSNDVPWTIPIVLDVSKDEIKGVKEGDEIALIVQNSNFLATMQIEEIYEFDKKELSLSVFGTTDSNHPGVTKVYGMKDLLLGGEIWLIKGLPSPFPKYDLAPVETRKLFASSGWKTVVGFQTRNVPHLGHEYLHKICLNFFDGLFINPIVGKKKTGDFRDEVILEAYATLIDKYYPKDKVALGILKTEMRYAGPKEAIFHAIIRKNFGCNYFIVGRDHAGVGNYYSPYAAQEIFNQFPDLGITPIPLPTVFYCKICQTVISERACPHNGDSRIHFSGTQVREVLRNNQKILSGILRPEVTHVISKWDKPFL
ncbi:MAG: sulfate adenylyltransferase [Candidatus Bathyarchaeia archaeon]